MLSVALGVVDEFDFIIIQLTVGAFESSWDVRCNVQTYTNTNIGWDFYRLKKYFFINQKIIQIFCVRILSIWTSIIFFIFLLNFEIFSLSIFEKKCNFFCHILFCYDLHKIIFSFFWNILTFLPLQKNISILFSLFFFPYVYSLKSILILLEKWVTMWCFAKQRKINYS